jgi:hypothetical protein
MRWMVELGRVDIAVEVSLLSSYLACPRAGYLEAAIHIIGYLREKHNTRFIFDPTYPKINENDFPQFDWTEFYGDVAEAIPTDMPKPLGKEVEIHMMVVMKSSIHGKQYLAYLWKFDELPAYIISGFGVL